MTGATRTAQSRAAPASHARAGLGGEARATFLRADRGGALRWAASIVRGVPEGTLLWAAPALGCALLVLRPLSGGVSAERMALLALVSAAAAALGLVGPNAGGLPDRAHATVALFVGLAALAAVMLLAGPRIAPRATGVGLALSVGAAVAEELLFRRALYARLLPFGPAVAIAGSALAFAGVHVPAYGWAAFPADLGAGLLFGWQRQASGGWTAPAATHAVANVIGGLW